MTALNLTITLPEDFESKAFVWNDAITQLKTDLFEPLCEFVKKNNLGTLKVVYTEPSEGKLGGIDCDFWGFAESRRNLRLLRFCFDENGGYAYINDPNSSTRCREEKTWGQIIEDLTGFFQKQGKQKGMTEGNLKKLLEAGKILSTN